MPDETERKRMNMDQRMNPATAAEAAAESNPTPAPERTPAAEAAVEATSAQAPERNPAAALNQKPGEASRTGLTGMTLAELTE